MNSRKNSAEIEDDGENIRDEDENLDIPMNQGLSSIKCKPSIQQAQRKSDDSPGKQILPESLVRPINEQRPQTLLKQTSIINPKGITHRDSERSTVKDEDARHHLVHKSVLSHRHLMGTNNNGVRWESRRSVTKVIDDPYLQLILKKQAKFFG